MKKLHTGKSEAKASGPSEQTEPSAVPPADHLKKARLKHLGGSDRDEFNIALANSVPVTAWRDTEQRNEAAVAFAGSGLAGINPRDVLEGMLAAQAIAAHQASMECFRRAMLSNQTVPGRETNLNQANKASRTFAALVETLNKHRTQGRQQVIVEHVHRHVHVHDNGQMPIIQTETGVGGAQIEKAEQPHAHHAVGYALQPTLRSEDAEHETLPRASDGEREVSDARRL